VGITGSRPVSDEEGRLRVAGARCAGRSAIDRRRCDRWHAAAASTFGDGWVAPPGRDPLRQARRRNAAEVDRAAHGLIRGDERLSGPRSSCQFRLGLHPAGAALRNRPSSRSGNSRSANRRRKPAGRCRAGTSRAGVMPEIDEPPLSPLGRAWVTRPEPLSSAFRFAESTPVCAPVHKLALINWLGVPRTAVLRRRCGNGSLCARHRLPLDRFPSAQRMAPRVAAPSRSTSLKRGVSIIQRLQSYPCP
jgi:hypothetical protein